MIITKEFFNKHSGEFSKLRSVVSLDCYCGDTYFINAWSSFNFIEKDSKLFSFGDNNILKFLKIETKIETKIRDNLVEQLGIRDVM